MNVSSHKNLQDFLQVSDIHKAQKFNGFLEHLFSKVDFHISKWWRILILTLTKKSAEEVSTFLISKWYKAFYLHSEIDTMDRWEIINKLKSWEIDILVWVNLLREWIDLPEVTFIWILDADKEWFLRSTKSLIQIIWRAARNPDSEVALYADNFTASIIKAMWENYRRRNVQQKFNSQHGISPKKAISNVKDLQIVKTDDVLDLNTLINRKNKTKKLKRMTKKEKEIIANELKRKLDELIKDWKFEEAAIIRDQLKELEEWSDYISNEEE